MGRKSKPKSRRDSRGYLVDSECSFEGCDKPVLSKGLCTGHYQQQHRGKPLRPLGDTSAARRQRYALKHFLK